MRRIVLASVLLACCFAFAAGPATVPTVIDWDKARTLYQREQSGEALSAEEQTYLDYAKAARRQAQRTARPTTAPAQRETTGLTPLTSAADAKYKGFALGLYGDGQNQPPADHAKRAAEAAAKIQPLDKDGKPSPDGRVVMISVGMSNTTQEFSRFVELARKHSDRNPSLVVVDAAQGGKAADSWSSRERMQTWDEAGKRLGMAGVSAQQVQVIWLKQARIGPAQLGAFPTHAQALQQDLKQIVKIAHEQFPNLKLIYLSSRTYAGWATTPLNPEPYAYESAFSVQWLIQSQMNGSGADLSYDKAPVLLWGPYLWTDGTKGRDADKLVWGKADTGPDGTHPSDGGRQKVAQLLMDFFSTDPTSKAWFTAASK